MLVSVDIASLIAASFLKTTTSLTQVNPSATPMHRRDAPSCSIHRNR